MTGGSRVIFRLKFGGRRSFACSPPGPGPGPRPRPRPRPRHLQHSLYKYEYTDWK